MKVICVALLIVVTAMMVMPAATMAKDPPNSSFDPCGYAAYTGWKDLHAVWNCVFEILRDLWALGESHWHDGGGT